MTVGWVAMWQCASVAKAVLTKAKIVRKEMRSVKHSERAHLASDPQLPTSSPPSLPPPTLGIPLPVSLYLSLSLCVSRNLHITASSQTYLFRRIRRQWMKNTHCLPRLRSRSQVVRKKGSRPTPPRLRQAPSQLAKVEYQIHATSLPLEESHFGC